MPSSKSAATEELNPPATAEDLLFLLSIVRNPESIIAEQQVQQQKNPSSKSTGAASSPSTGSWRQTLASLPLRRRSVILSLRDLANSLDVLINSPRSPGDADTGNNEGGHHLCIEKIENSAGNLRECLSNYSNSYDAYRDALTSFWIREIRSIDDDAQLENVGGQLATNLLSQLDWEVHELCVHTIFDFLDEDLYDHLEKLLQRDVQMKHISYHQPSYLKNRNIEQSSSKTLRLWADAMNRMIKTDKSFWKFVECEVHDEIELMESDNPELINNQLSSVFVSFNDIAEDDRDERSPVVDGDDGVIGRRELHSSILSFGSVEEVMNSFLNQSTCSGQESNCWHNMNPPITTVLLLGEEGCGKTYMLDSIHRTIKAHPSGSSSGNGTNNESVRVIRPTFPMDLIGSTIGSSEDRLISLFSYASDVISSSSTHRGQNCVILLDDVDKIFSLAGATDGGFSGASTHISRRCKALFLSIIDAFRESSSSSNYDGHLLLLCTARSSCEELAGRFDRTFVRGQPDELQRRNMILTCLTNHDGSNANQGVKVDEGVDEILSLVVHHSAGRSAYELSQCCRNAILAESANNGSNEGKTVLTKRLRNLDAMLQSISPQSLRGGSLDGIVDMTIFTPEELQSRITTDSNGEMILPLLGAEAQRAYDALMNVLIIPLCRSDEIRDLLYGKSEQSINLIAKPIRVGALLAGKPGVGKTSLAYHVASVAAKMSRVTLLDVSCTSLIHKEIGGSERAVQKLFTAVRAAAPCILLLDGIENIAPKRGNDNTSEGTMDRVLSTFLTEMDGIETGGNNDTSGNVAVIGVTHNPDLIDPSLRRPGRLEKTITLGTLDYEARSKLVAQHIKDLDIDFESAGYFDAKNKTDLSQLVALESAGMSAVEVIAICREASMECLRDLDFEIEANMKPKLKIDHFKKAIKIMKGKS
ncbi:hypothetical protein ACHAXS_004580 [Conticribra weissflogii]